MANSRHQKKSNQVWRRRHCVSCQGTFTTIEQADLPLSLLYKKDLSHVEPFSRDKLFLSLYNSLKHRQTALSDASSLTATVIGKLLLTVKAASVDRSTIIQTATETLKHFDKAASVTYSAYHSL
ncbi:MAG TPA: hypothetical protein VLF90_02415 [Patescibacteria group bacterium]|nr:hypothetical protein [Patescibacteria group bacterium]